MPEESANTQPIILVVDDEALLRVVLADHLEGCGFRVVETDSADEALRILQSGEMIDLVLSDIRIPGSMDGFGLARWIRENRKGLPIFLTSGDRNKMDAVEQLCESEPFFSKPFDLESIATHIRIALQVDPRPPSS